MQDRMIISRSMYQKYIFPGHQQLFQYVHQNSDCAVFLHSCGSIRPLIPDLIAAGVDILNPVQTSAKNMDPRQLKEEFGKQITFWGGGCDTQHVLPFATPDEVARHVREQIEIFAPGGGFVFNQIHNIQADIPPENIVAMFDTAREFKLLAKVSVKWQDVKDRAKSFVESMTLREKISQMVHQSRQISRLGIPAYNWWNECLHGVGRAGIATVFPQPIGLAAMFDEPFIKEIAAVISDEVRAKYNEATGQE